MFLIAAMVWRCLLGFAPAYLRDLCGSTSGIRDHVPGCCHGLEVSAGLCSGIPARSLGVNLGYQRLQV